MKISKEQQELEKMARFYLKKLFYNIPYIPVEYSNNLEDSKGIFEMEMADDYVYENDELLNSYEYRWKYISMEDGMCGVDIGGDRSWEDPINHPKLAIRISARYTNNIRKLTAILLHELLHYYCWHTGLEHHDDSEDFLEKCKEMDIPTNYSDYIWEDGRWKDVFDYTKVDKYIKMYAKEKVLALIEELVA